MEEKKQDTALLVMDMQSAILQGVPRVAALSANIAKAIAHARVKNIPVLYVVVGFRPGAPEINTENKGFASVRDRHRATDHEEWLKIEPLVQPSAGDIVIMKRRVSAFTGSDLEVVLRSLGIRRMVLTGFATSGVVLSTVREAADKDYRITVLSDCCADRDEEVHRVLTTKVLPRQADVFTVDEWIRV